MTHLLEEVGRNFALGLESVNVRILVHAPGGRNPERLASNQPRHGWDRHLKNKKNGVNILALLTKTKKEE